MTIRPIQIEDNQVIAKVIRQVFISDNYPKTGTAFADMHLDTLFETYNKPKSIYYIVEDFGKIIGGAGISQLENSTENICELQKMYFLQEARGKGIGMENKIYTGRNDGKRMEMGVGASKRNGTRMTQKTVIKNDLKKIKKNLLSF